MPPPELPLFDIDLVQCDEDLGALVARLGRPGAPRRWSICLHGPSGTGKSLFARYLARQIGLEVVQKRASDLLSKWVGDSEKQIARAFAEARAEQAVLVLDEADGLLYDRRSATHGWEVSQVGELLAQMEDHPWPFICTTNLVGSLDRASLRRFTLKLRFDPLRPTQAALAFERFFGAPAPRPLPEGLTPGDFATVRGMRDVFGSAEPEQLIRWLEAEVEAKGYRIHRVGFRAGAA